jgi:hypothetical protein
MKNYVYLVADLLRFNRYCLLKDYVILTVYYRLIKPDSDGEYVGNEPPEDVYERHLEPFKYSYLSKLDDCLYIHVTPNVNTTDSPLECRHIKLNQHLINKRLDKSFTLFEEEIYTFITLLNFRPTEIRDLLNFSFADATRFIPVDVQMRVVDYDIAPIHCGARKEYFGPKVDPVFLFQPREIEGRMSGAKSNSRIVSLRDGEGWKKDKSPKPEWTHSISPYVVYLAVEQNGYLPLAFNPFENPIIV